MVIVADPQWPINYDSEATDGHPHSRSRRIEAIALRRVSSDHHRGLASFESSYTLCLIKEAFIQSIFGQRSEANEPFVQGHHHTYGLASYESSYIHVSARRHYTHTAYEAERIRSVIFSKKALRIGQQLSAGNYRLSILIASSYT